MSNKLGVVVTIFLLPIIVLIYLAALEEAMQIISEERKKK